MQETWLDTVWHEDESPKTLVVCHVDGCQLSTQMARVPNL